MKVTSFAVGSEILLDQHVYRRSSDRDLNGNLVLVIRPVAKERAKGLLA